jgi:hypothetical protein
MRSSCTEPGTSAHGRDRTRVNAANAEGSAGGVGECRGRRHPASVGSACATGRRRVDLVHGDPPAWRLDGDEHGRPAARSANRRASRCGRDGHCCGLFRHLAHLDHGPAPSPGTDPRCRGWHHVGRRRFYFDRLRRLGPKVAAEVDDPDASAFTTVLAARQAPTSATHYFRQMIALCQTAIKLCFRLMQRHRRLTRRSQQEVQPCAMSCRRWVCSWRWR